MRRRRSSICPRCKSRLYDVPVVRPVVLGTRQGIDEILGPHRDVVLRLARNAGADGLWVFGSVRRRDAGPRSDVDLLVTWKPTVSLLDIATLADALDSELGRRVELVNRDDLHWAMAPQILSEAVPL
jgi:uncharacterized protein